MYEKWPWTIEKIYIASLCKQHLITFDEESNQFCKWVLLQEKCWQGTGSFLAKLNTLLCWCCAWNRWCMTRLQMLDIWELSFEAHIILLKSLASSWFKIPEETPTLQSNSAFAKFTVCTKGRCTLTFSLKCLNPVATSHSDHMTHIMHDLFFVSYSTHLTQWVQTCTYDMVSRSLINISYHNIPHRMPSDRCTWAVWTQQRMILTEICFPFLQVIAKTAKKLRRD